MLYEVITKREKQIDKVLRNTSDMYSSIKGIAGNAIPVVRRLELPGAEDEDSSDSLGGEVKRD